MLAMQGGLLRSGVDTGERHRGKEEFTWTHPRLLREDMNLKPGRIQIGMVARNLSVDRQPKVRWDHCRIVFM